MAIFKNTNIDDVGFIRLPAGNTAQRPASPVAGMVRFNTDLNYMEGYNGTNWVSMAFPLPIPSPTIIPSTPAPIATPSPVTPPPTPAPIATPAPVVASPTTPPPVSCFQDYTFVFGSTQSEACSSGTSKSIRYDTCIDRWYVSDNGWDGWTPATGYTVVAVFGPANAGDIFIDGYYQGSHCCDGFTWDAWSGTCT
jgi:hypothetical protein